MIADTSVPRLVIDFLGIVMQRWSQAAGLIVECNLLSSFDHDSGNKGNLQSALLYQSERLPANDTLIVESRMGAVVTANVRYRRHATLGRQMASIQFT